MRSYNEIKNAIYSGKHEGIFYAFSDDQFAEGLKNCGYSSADDVVADGCGGYGSREAFANRARKFATIDEEIKSNCTPEEVFSAEWWNYECGYTWEYSQPLRIVRRYWPGWEIPKELLLKLSRDFDELN